MRTLAAPPPADDRLYGPYAFGVGWLVAGIVAIALAVLLTSVAVRRERVARVAVTPRDVATLRADYLYRLDHLAARFDGGELDARAVHHELSRVLRGFAADAGTAGATAMSAAALELAGQRPVAVAVRSYEVPQFAARTDRDPTSAIARARAVVGSWQGDT